MMMNHIHRASCQRSLSSLVGTLLLVSTTVLILLGVTPLGVMQSSARAQSGLAYLRARYDDGVTTYSSAVNLGRHPRAGTPQESGGVDEGVYVFVTAYHSVEENGVEVDPELWVRGGWLRARRLARWRSADLCALLCGTGRTDLHCAVPAPGYSGQAVACGFPGDFTRDPEQPWDFYGVVRDGAMRLNNAYPVLHGLSGGGLFAYDTCGLVGVVYAHAGHEVSYRPTSLVVDLLREVDAVPVEWSQRLGISPTCVSPGGIAPVAPPCPVPPAPTPGPTPAIDISALVTRDELAHHFEELRALISETRGEKGDKGDRGERGLTGLTGDTGAPGASGAPGRGIASVWLIDNALWVRYDDNQEIRVGTIDVRASEVDINAIVQQVLAQIQIPQPQPGKDGAPGTVNVIIQDSGEEVGRYDNLDSGSTVIVDVQRFLRDQERRSSVQQAQ
jgi:hypothetical protein